QNTDSISLFEHLMLLLQHQTPTFIDCNFLKICTAAVEAFCSSAKKRDYEVFRLSRQPLVFHRFALQRSRCLARDRTIANGSLVWQDLLCHLPSSPRFLQTVAIAWLPKAMLVTLASC
ncbi:hypothetical protein, partial [Duganella sp. BK701]|uniref:hypothetical protein n=1 Tax=Duganella sp. BK701 TaxID=2512166 RepID=UPI001A90F25A